MIPRTLNRPGDLIVALVGQTASGKSDLSLDLAHSLPPLMGCAAAEVVSADALQLYRGMDIGTAKIPEGERRGIPHHQIDVLNVSQEASVARYQSEARADVEGIHQRSGLALVVGGSGLYQRALLDHLEFPGTDPQIRAALEEQAQGPLGSRGLHARLAALDPHSAQRIDPHNTRRIIRALEVIELTGGPYSATMPERVFIRPSVMIAIRHEQALLDERIEKRTRNMFQRGLVEEVRELLDKGLKEGRTARCATGYAEAMGVIEGVLSAEEAIDSVTAATRRLSRKQAKWLRPDPRLHWIDADCPEVQLRQASEIVQRSLEEYLSADIP